MPALHHSSQVGQVQFRVAVTEANRVFEPGVSMLRILVSSPVSFKL